MLPNPAGFLEFVCVMAFMASCLEKGFITFLPGGALEMKWILSV
jgi:hypothetical protein